jgi:hypothetical protein
VQREGLVAAGDPITVIARDAHGVRVADITRAIARKGLASHQMSLLSEGRPNAANRPIGACQHYCCIRTRSRRPRRHGTRQKP